MTGAHSAMASGDAATQKATATRLSAAPGSVSSSTTKASAASGPDRRGRAGL